LIYRVHLVYVAPHSKLAQSGCKWANTGNKMTDMLRDRIDQAMKEAMKARDKRRTATTRLINAAIKDRKIQNRGAGKGDVVDDGEVMEILAKMVKQRRDSIKMYEDAGRLELAEQEREEIAIVQEFLPAQMSAEEMQGAVKAVIADLGAAGLKDMGRTMGALKEKHAGQMDFGKASALVKAQLG
jgi:uncharacterized protein YqeY